MAGPDGLGTATVRGRAVAAWPAVALVLVLAGCGTARFGASAQASSTTAAPTLAQSAPALSAPPLSTPAAPGSASGSAAATASGTSGYPLARLAVILHQMIRTYGGTHIVVAQGVRTDRASALALGTPGDDAGEGHGVAAFLLQADGDFVANGVSIPYGAKPPTGHQLMVVVDARRLTITDGGLGNGHADIGRLGQVFALPTTG